MFQLYDFLDCNLTPNDKRGRLLGVSSLSLSLCYWVGSGHQLIQLSACQLVLDQHWKEVASGNPVDQSLFLINPTRFSEMGDEAEKKFWRSPELVEKLISCLDTGSILALAKCHQLTLDLLP